MDNIKFYEIDRAYIDYLSEYEKKLFHNSKDGQYNERKYIGVILEINGMKYFAPLSSHKKKHETMSNALDFIKVGRYAVLNLNNMFPAAEGTYKYIDFSLVEDEKYKNLLLKEYRFIRAMQEKICNNARILYQHKNAYGNDTPLARRCNDFQTLESACKEYVQKQELIIVH